MTILLKRGKKMKWTNWKSIKNLSNVPSEPGLYKICLKKSRKPYPTQRMLKEDKKRNYLYRKT